VNRQLLITGAALVLVAACGVSADGELQQIDSADLFGLDVTTTSTSTSTSVVVAPTVVVETTGLVTTTTIATESVDLYFLDGNRLEPVSIPLTRNPSPQRVVTALVDGEVLSSAVGIGLRTLLPEDLVNDVDESGTGYVTVDVAGEPFDQIDPADQRAAIAQIVLTLVSRPGVGQVKFTRDGVPMRVPRRGGLQSEAGELVSLLDYESLLRAGEPEPATTTTTTTTTVPPTVPATSGL
jgi:hypothetical protein